MKKIPISCCLILTFLTIGLALGMVAHAQAPAAAPAPAAAAPAAPLTPADAQLKDAAGKAPTPRTCRKAIPVAL